jgi:hypothetical protein
MRSASILSVMTAVCCLLTVAPASADVGVTYLGAFHAFSGTPGIYGGGLTYYPAGNGGAGSLFLSRSPVGSGKEIFEITIPPLVSTTDINALNTATTLNSFDVSTNPNGLVWRSADDRLYYSKSAAGSGAILVQSINRDGSGESAAQSGPAWNEGGNGLCVLPDAWAAASAAGKSMMTIGTNRGVVFSSIDPWNTPMGFTQLWKYGTNPTMTGYTYGDAHYGIAWIEVDTAQDMVFTGSELPGPEATLWFMRASDFASRGAAVPQPYLIQSVQGKLLTTAKALYGAAYDSTNHILYAYEGALGTATVVHAWSVYDAASINNPPTTITSLVASSPGYYEVTLTWTAPQDDHGVGGKAAGYDVRYSTSPIDDTNWDTAIQASGEPSPSSPGLPEQMVVTGLSRGTTYYFAVKSYDEVPQYSALSNVVSATTDDDQVPPAAVTDLAASNVLSGRLQLSWSATGDNGMTGLASSYDIRYSTSEITEANFAAATAVAQNLTPRAPGLAETLQVTGLSPSTTYYFAIKVADKMPNWSALSNVVLVTTNPLPSSPPAAVTDLAVTGSDALSATLAWSAPADANGSAVTSYEIRYSTATITSANWSSATVAPNLLAPKAPGTAETFTIIGLQPSTTYYFAIKGIDEIGNIADISSVATCTTPALADMPVVTTVTLVEKAGVATTNYPVTLSLGFARGDVAGNVTVRTPTLVLPTQTDVKVSWDDGSVRHALVSFILPQIGVGESVPVEILAGGPNYTTGWMTKEQLLAGDFEAVLAMAVGSVPQNASARQILNGMAEPQYWIKGGICTEFIIQDWLTRYFGQLNVSYRVRVYPSTGAIRVSTVVDNTFIDSRGNLTYDFTLSLGRSSPQSVFAKTGFAHWCDARWHKVFWQGATPPRIETRYDLAYWIKGGFLPSYDTSLVVPSSTITNAYNSWNSSAHDIMQGAGLTKYFPTTGGRSEIGPYPLWTSQYLCSMDHRLAEVTINYGDLSGTVPMHFRESDPARSAYCRPISIDDRPSIWTSQVDVSYIQQYIDPADRFPPAIGDLTTDWSVDLAHQPSLAYVPYLMTGDLYYLEEMHFWACFDLGASHGAYRGYEQGWLIDQIRGNAWALRNIVDAAAMTPDGMPEKAYLDEKIANNTNRWTTNYIVNGQLAGLYPTVRCFGTSGIDSSLDPATCSAGMSSWQTDYMIWSLLHASQMGYPILDMVHWAGQGAIDRFADWPGWNRYRGTVYVFPARGKDAGGNPVPFATWADVNNGFVDKVGPGSIGGAGNPNSYEYASRGVLALVSNISGGLPVYDWINGLLPISVCASDPRWAFVPPAQPTGDINGDAAVDVVDLLFFVDTFGLMIGDAGYDPAGDFNADHSVDVVDLLIFVENFGL